MTLEHLDPVQPHHVVCPKGALGTGLRVWLERSASTLLAIRSYSRISWRSLYLQNPKTTSRSARAVTIPSSEVPPLASCPPTAYKVALRSISPPGLYFTNSPFHHFIPYRSGSVGSWVPPLAPSVPAYAGWL